LSIAESHRSKAGIFIRRYEDLLQMVEDMHKDFLSRYAGDEFVALLPEVAIEDALKAAERLRKHLSETSLSTDAGALWVTTSLGAAEVDDSMPSLDELLGRAAKALNESKDAGGNRVSSWKP